MDDNVINERFKSTADEEKLVYLSENDKPQVFSIFFDSTFRDRVSYPNPCMFGISNKTRSEGSMINPVSPCIPYTFLENQYAESQFFNIYYVESSSYLIENLAIGFPKPRSNLGNEDAVVIKSDNNPYITNKILYSLYHSQELADIMRAQIDNWDFFMRDRLTGTHDFFDNSYLFFKQQKGYEDGIHLISAIISTNELALDATASSIDGYYNGWWIWVDNFYEGSYPVENNAIFTSKILSYNGTTKIAVLSDPIASHVAVGKYYEVIPPMFDVDYYNPVLINSITRGMKEIYSVRLVSLTLPISNSINSIGGRISDYPYVCVHVGNEKISNTSNNTVSNIRNIKGQFIMPITDINPFIGYNYYHLKECYTDIDIYLDLSAELFLTITTPDGIILNFGEDFKSPMIPRPDRQVSAVFRVVKKCNQIPCSMYGKEVTVAIPRSFV